MKLLDNKKILILGMARSGYETAKFLKNRSCDILITDMQEQEESKIKELESLGIKYIITNKQEDLLDNSFDYVIKNPGVPIDAPCVIKAKQLNIPLTNEVEVSYHYLPKNVKIIGITGSNGKTTTSTIVYDMMRKAKLPVHLGGNIGIPMISLLNNIKENDYLVIELSSHQLHDFMTFKTDISVLTNLTETHLEHFHTFEAYKNSKKKIFYGHSSSDVAIINLDDLLSKELTNKILSKKIYFSSKDKAKIDIQEDYICYDNEKIIKLDNIKIKGKHNYENIMSAIAVVKEFNISNQIINEVLQEFPGVEHRIEYVKTLKNRKFYNDSKSTNILATKTALSSFDDPTIILLGGLDRNQNLDELIPFMKNVKKINCYGEIKSRIKIFADENNIECSVLNTLEEATINAYKSSKEGDIILLSPACASWDQFKDYEARGNEFKRIIESLN